MVILHQKYRFLLRDFFSRFLNLIRHSFRRMCNSGEIVSFKNGKLLAEDIASRKAFLDWIEKTGCGCSKSQFLETSDAVGEPCRALVILQAIEADIYRVSAANYVSLILNNCVLDNILENGIERTFTKCEQALALLYRIRPMQVASGLNDILFDLLESNPQLAIAYLERTHVLNVPIAKKVILRLLDNAQMYGERWNLAMRLCGGDRTPIEHAEIEKAFNKIRHPEGTTPQEIPHIGEAQSSPSPENPLPNSTPQI